MKLIGVMPVRNEDWVLGLTARAALMWCDELVILTHACTDKSTSIVRDLERVTILAEYDPDWAEMEDRMWLLETARICEATHIAIIDADELLTGNLLPAIRREIETAPHGFITQLPGYNLRGGTQQYHANGTWGNRWFSTAFKDQPELHWGGDQFHHREPMGAALQAYRPIRQHAGGIIHLWGASERRLIAKHALYKITERLRWPDKPVAEIDRMYSMAIKGRPEHGETPDTWIFRDVPRDWWKPYAHLLHHLNLDAVPWQEAEVRRLVELHGVRLFTGLDLFALDSVHESTTP